MLASALALAFSLIEASAAHGVKSERLHANALKLRALMRQVGALPQEHSLALYHEALAECPENHLPIDWRLALARRDAPGRATELRYALAGFGWRGALLALGLAGAVAQLAWV